MSCSYRIFSFVIAFLVYSSLSVSHAAYRVGLCDQKIDSIQESQSVALIQTKLKELFFEIKNDHGLEVDVRDTACSLTPSEQEMKWDVLFTSYAIEQKTKDGEGRVFLVNTKVHFSEPKGLLDFKFNLNGNIHKSHILPKRITSLSAVTFVELVSDGYSISERSEGLFEKFKTALRYKVLSAKKSLYEAAIKELQKFEELNELNKNERLSEELLLDSIFLNKNMMGDTVDHEYDWQGDLLKLEALHRENPLDQELFQAYIYLNLKYKIKTSSQFASFYFRNERYFMDKSYPLIAYIEELFRY
jgi:hypothetical protein